MSWCMISFAICRNNPKTLKSAILRSRCNTHDNFLCSLPSPAAFSISDWVILSFCWWFMIVSNDHVLRATKSQLSLSKDKLPVWNFQSIYVISSPRWPRKISHFSGTWDVTSSRLKCVLSLLVSIQWLSFERLCIFPADSNCFSDPNSCFRSVWIWQVDLRRSLQLLFSTIENRDFLAVFERPQSSLGSRISAKMKWNVVILTRWNLYERKLVYFIIRGTFY